MPRRATDGSPGTPSPGPSAPTRGASLPAPPLTPSLPVRRALGPAARSHIGVAAATITCLCVPGFGAMRWHGLEPRLGAKRKPRRDLAVARRRLARLICGGLAPCGPDDGSDRNESRRETRGRPDIDPCARAGVGGGVRPARSGGGGGPGAGDRRRRVDLPRRRRLAHAVHDGRPARPVELRAARGRLAVERDQLRPRHGAGHALPRRGQAHHRGRQPAPRGRPRPRHRRAALELPRAEHVPLRVLDAQGLREGRGLHRDRRPRRRVHHLAGLLPARPRRRHRPAPSRAGGAPCPSTASATPGPWTWSRT